MNTAFHVLISEGSVNESNVVKDLLADLNAFIGSAMQLQSTYERYLKEDPDVANIFAKGYPFQKSFDEVGIDLINWRDQVRDGLLS